MLYKDFLKELTGCPFCSDQNRFIDEQETAYLTYALAPYHRHHLLVVPKRHSEVISEMDDAQNRDVDILTNTGIKILKKLGYKNISVLVREGNDASKSIPHLHYHIIPDTRLGDIDHYGNERVVLNNDEVAKLVSELSGLL
ncbi:MAG: HIT family protein [Candidatus Paceibacterota bacterium]|jgi:diadenosine tetraphosphate (Ap4A) HIT family hydrolase